MNPTILVIDDDPSVTASFAQLLETRGYRVETASRTDEVLQSLSERNDDLVITDVCMPGMSGLEALDILRRHNPLLPVIVMTGQGSVNTAIEATKRGAFDYLMKPIEPETLLKVVEKAIRGSHLMKAKVSLGTSDDADGIDALVGMSPAMQTVYKAIGKVAPTEATVLIRGDTGTGKELVARAIYQHSLRAQAPLIVVNCAAIPETLLESELFGHERGAFSGAVNRRIGRFEQADGGTIFLDEIGELPLSLQAKLLRVLQEQTFDRLGGELIRVNVRVLAATNRDVESLLNSGRFREDLYHRLNVVSIRLAPLRERREDFSPLVAYFSRRYANELGRTPLTISSEAMEALQGYSWPGNVRELQHVIQRLHIFCQASVASDSEVREALEQDAAACGEIPWQQSLETLVGTYLSRNRGEQCYEAFLQEVERQLLVEGLRRSHGNQTLAARLLGLTRSTLQAKVSRLRLRDSISQDQESQ